MKKPQTVVIFYVDGKNLDVQEIKDTLKNISDALLSRKYSVTIVKVNKKNWKQAIKTEGDVYFNLVEDETWELYRKIVFGLEKMKKAQVGHNLDMMEYAIDKKVMKKKLIRAGIATPKYRIFSNGDKFLHHIRKMEYPLIVKPAGQHAGIGISQDSVVIDEQEANERIEYIYKNYDGGALVEEFIDGQEITITVIGYGNKIWVLPPAELVYFGEYANNWPIYSYNAKWVEGTWEYNQVKVVCPTDIDAKLQNRAKKMAKKAFEKLGMCDVVRFDMRIDERTRKVYVVDVNASPSLAKHQWEGTYLSALAYGWSYEDLIEHVVLCAYRRVRGE